MTYRNIFIQAVASASGKPEAELRELLAAACIARPEIAEKSDREIPDDEARKLLADLREEAPGILAWLARGAMEVESAGSNTVQ